jgi:uncharacterized protein with von Willebrand factor type A (vWA) domain
LALRATLCSRDDDLAAFDAAFAEWFVPAPWSDVELLREKDFADYTDEERRRARRMIDGLAQVAATTPSRRTRRARRRGDMPPAARLGLRATLRAGGDPFERHWREPGERPRQLVLVCDMSDSTEPYAHMLLAYMQACSAVRRRVEAFVFGAGMGEALATLNTEHGRRVAPGAVVVLLSDGWDRGDPAQLERELDRLARCSHRLISVNPRPPTREIQAALPHVDDFMVANSLASLKELAETLDRLAMGRA